MTGVSFACMAKHKEFSAFQNAYRESPQREEQGRRDRVPESAVSEEWHKHQSEGVDLMPLKGMANLVMSSAEATRFFKLRGRPRKHAEEATRSPPLPMQRTSWTRRRRTAATCCGWRCSTR